jgi:hypothetical protein
MDVYTVGNQSTHLSRQQILTLQGLLPLREGNREILSRFPTYIYFFQMNLEDRL